MNLPTHTDRSRALTLIEVMVIVACLSFLAVMMGLKLGEAKAKASRIKCIGNNKITGLGFRIWANDNDDRYPYRTPTRRDQSTGTTVPNVVYHNESDAWLYFVVMSNELGSSKMVMCPSDRERRKYMATDFSTASYGLQFLKNQAVSYFIGPAADETKPLVLLLGDRHMETNVSNVTGSLLTFTATNLPSWTASHHRYAGNITLSDGSVQQVSTPWLQTNALAGLRSLGMETNRLLMPW